MKTLKIWNIPRTDIRDRCGECLLPFLKKVRKQKYHCKKWQGSRFPDVCGGCKMKIDNEGRKLLDNEIK